MRPPSATERSGPFVVAAVQAAYAFMDRDATIGRVELLTLEAAALGARLVVFPEAFVPGTPLWIDTIVPWDGDAQWYARLADQAVVVPSAHTQRLGAAASAAGVYLVVGVNERDPHGCTVYNTILYFGPDGTLLATHRKLMPTGSERVVWGMGDGSTLEVVDTELGRLGGLICWENYMPLARFHLYAQGVDVWLAPTLATGDGWIATMRHLAREGRMWVVGVNPCADADAIPDGFPGRQRIVTDASAWLEPGNTVICDPFGEIVAGPAREIQTILTAEIDIAKVREARRQFDPVGHYNRPDVFRLQVDTRRRPAVTTVDDPMPDLGLQPVDAHRSGQEHPAR